MIFTILGEPQGKARARTFMHSHTGKSTTITPEKTVLYENLICLMFNQAKPKEYNLYDKFIVMSINAYFGIPKSKSKKIKQQMLDGEILPTKKPDLDNICKVVCDALNGHAYKDDSQVVSLSIHKRYSDNPRIEVNIY